MAAQPARLSEIAREFRVAAGDYRTIAIRVEVALGCLGEERTSQGPLNLVKSFCVPYVLKGAEALDVAATKLIEAAAQGEISGSAYARPAPQQQSQAPSHARPTPQQQPQPQARPASQRQPQFQAQPRPASRPRHPSLSGPALVLTDAARDLGGYVGRLQDLAAEAGRNIVGDTHPYGDLIWGIVVPYLTLAADELSS